MSESYLIIVVLPEYFFASAQSSCQDFGRSLIRSLRYAKPVLPKSVGAPNGNALRNGAPISFTFGTAAASNGSISPASFSCDETGTPASVRSNAPWLVEIWSICAAWPVSPLATVLTVTPGCAFSKPVSSCGPYHCGYVKSTSVPVVDPPLDDAPAAVPPS